VRIRLLELLVIDMLPFSDALRCAATSTDPRH